MLSSAVFLSVRPSLIAVRFGSSFQLLSRGFRFAIMVEEGDRWKREKEGEGRRRSGKVLVADQTAGMAERVPRPQVSVCRIHKGDTKRLRRREPKNSVNKESPFWDSSIEGERAREP